ncbi:hypothetical protein C4573_04075 [Candidatus Woesearchaeota archaeon]|nr:MAG: hypothetical protein C4573_04075 [Candidatus Woesearchaeota archaeon]
MKKKWMMAIFIVVAMAVMIDQVAALGVAPSRDLIDFSPGQKTLTARIINNDHKDMRIALYPKGDLEQYVQIDNPIITVKADESEKSFTYTINLPDKLEPGTQKVGIILVELPETFVESDDNLLVSDENAILFANKKKDALISATTAVIYQLGVRVPYPDTYIESGLYVTEGKIGDLFTFTIPLVNRGEKATSVYADIVIKGPTNEEIARFKTETITLEGLKEGKLQYSWKADVNQGSYIAEAVVHYNGKVIELNKKFGVGNLFIEIQDLKVDSFKLGGIAKFDVYLKNQWNEPIKDVYGELKVLDKDGNSINSFKTLSTDIPSYGDATINGYWDTTGVDVGSYDVRVILNYAGKTSEKLFQTVVGIDKIQVGSTTGKVTGDKGGGSNISLLIILIAVLIAINIGWFVFFRKRMKKPPVSTG